VFTHFRNIENPGLGGARVELQEDHIILLNVRSVDGLNREENRLGRSRCENGKFNGRCGIGVVSPIIQGLTLVGGVATVSSFGNPQPRAFEGPRSDLLFTLVVIDGEGSIEIIAIKDVDGTVASVSIESDIGPCTSGGDIICLETSSSPVIIALLQANGDLGVENIGDLWGGGRSSYH